jgi:hypothetical protein
MDFASVPAALSTVNLGAHPKLKFCFLSPVFKESNRLVITKTTLKLL